jgi:hypothetical protein
MNWRTVIVLTAAVGFGSEAAATNAIPVIDCTHNVLSCLKKAFERCPKNVTFIRDRSTELGFRVLPRGTQLVEKNIRGMATRTICTPK